MLEKNQKTYLDYIDSIDHLKKKDIDKTIKKFKLELIQVIAFVVEVNLHYICLL